MKAEERKELATNDLAASIDKLIKGIKEGPSKNTMTWGVLAIAAVALVLAMFYTYLHFSAESKQLDSERWEQLNQLNSENSWSVKEDTLQKFADNKDNDGTPQARLARFELARYWIQSDRQLASPLHRTEALKNVEKARDMYEKLTKEANDAPALAQEALMGAAKSNETLGDTAKARTWYEKLTKEYPNSLFGKDAAKQLERLDKDAQDLESLKTLFDKKVP